MESLNVDCEYKRGVAPLQNAFVKKWRPLAILEIPLRPIIHCKTNINAYCYIQI